MNVYKLKTTDWEPKLIDRTKFENETALRLPYYRRNSVGEESIFAVCPACNNPIQLIGLYPKKAEQSRAPFGRHVPHGVDGIASYNQEAYNFCPYASPQRYDSEAKKHPESGIAKYILHVLREQFDRIIYLLSQEIGIVISDKLAQAMLEKYLGAEGYLYVGATLLNIPWMLVYRSGSHSLYGRIIHKNSELEAALRQHANNALINEHGQLVQQKGQYLNIGFCFVGHQAKITEMNLEESVELLVTQESNSKIKEVFRKKLVLNSAHFQALANLPVDHPNRKMTLVEIARRLIQP